MLFNSIEFAVFLPIVFLLYWFVFDYALRGCKRQLLWQNLFVVVASYIFYGWWDWRFLILIAITTLCSYLSGLLISYGSRANTREEPISMGGGISSQSIRQLRNSEEQSINHDSTQGGSTEEQLVSTHSKPIGNTTLPQSRPNTIQRLCRNPKLWLWLNIVLNLGILGTFKYYDFFASSFAHLFGLQADSLLLHLILPVGISFYTFQALSYSIDVYRGQITATRDIVAFTAFLSFFPQLVAGPIERATNLLPQFLQRRHFDYAVAVDGMRQILWGLFKKIVVADNCATYVDKVFADYGAYSGSTLVLAAILFSIQIYGDFSGYSDIAIGTSKLFGIRLMRNFNVPYFSRDIAEFWRRWHISLTTWFRDYVYIPLGGSRPTVPARVQNKEAYKRAVIVRNTFIIFLLSGFWHGANWTFVLWGAYHALLFMPLILLGKNRRYRDTVATDTATDGTVHSRLLPSWRETGQMLLTFALVVLGWIFFRADTIVDAFGYLVRIPHRSLLSVPFLVNRQFYIPLFCAILLLFSVEWFNRTQGGVLTMAHIHNKAVRWLLYLGLIMVIAVFGEFEQVQFIYFQF